MLLVDDSPLIRRRVRSALRSHGFEAEAVETLPQLHMRLGHFLPDVVVMDLQMPGLTGDYLCRQLRRDANVPVIVYSAVSTVEGRSRAWAAGADAYVSKADGFDALALAIRDVLQNAEYVTSAP